MRLWSLHPKYLDQKGLSGLWREALLARSVIEKGPGTGYYNHSQLVRFKNHIVGSSIGRTLNIYLKVVIEEANIKRGYSFNWDKVWSGGDIILNTMAVTRGQMIFEATFLLDKINNRAQGFDEERYNKLKKDLREGNLKLHPLFYEVPGTIESWEKT